jgi:hypothetical protein
MRAIALVLATMLAAATAASAGTRLDDRASPRSQVNIESRFLHSGEGLSPDEFNALVANISSLEFRLDTSRYVGKRGRIYLVVPDLVPGVRSPSAMRIEWKTRGVFMPGSALPGQRTLVYDGPIVKAMTQESLDFVFYLDARHLERGVRFEPAFEIDVAP